jgi:hypothetical protein
MSSKTTKFILSLTLAASVAAIALTAITPAFAADIYDRRSGASEDPRYADIYGYPEPSRPLGPPRRAYLAPMPPDYFNGEPRSRRRTDACASHHEIRSDLTAQGWSEFHDIELRQSTALIEARRPNGNLYQLKIDRCSGEILNAQRLGDRRGPYASQERDFGRAY